MTFCRPVAVKLVPVTGELLTRAGLPPGSSPGRGCSRSSRVAIGWGRTPRQGHLEGASGDGRPGGPPGNGHMLCRGGAGRDRLGLAASLAVGGGMRYPRLFNLLPSDLAYCQHVWPDLYLRYPYDYRGHYFRVQSRRRDVHSQERSALDRIGYLLDVGEGNEDSSGLGYVAGYFGPVARSGTEELYLKSHAVVMVDVK